jgi:hypothetical protein
MGLLLVLYVASVGPAYHVLGGENRVVNAAYWPLFKVCRRYDPVSRALDRYFFGRDRRSAQELRCGKTT